MKRKTFIVLLLSMAIGIFSLNIPLKATEFEGNETSERITEMRKRSERNLV